MDSLGPLPGFFTALFGPDTRLQEFLWHGDTPPMSKLAILVPKLFPYSDSCANVVICGMTVHEIEVGHVMMQEQLKGSSTARAALPYFPHN